MFEFLKPQIVYFKPQDLDSESFLNEKYKSFMCGNVGFNPKYFFDDVFRPLGYGTSGNRYVAVNGYDMFNYDITTEFKWEDRSIPYHIRFNLKYENEMIKLHSIEYQDYSLKNEEITYNVVKASSTKNAAPFGYGFYDQGVFTYKNNFSIEIRHLSDVEPMVEQAKIIIEKTKKDLETNVKIYEMLKTDQFQEKFKELKQQQKTLTQAKKDLITKTAKTVMNIVSMGEDF